MPTNESVKSGLVSYWKYLFGVSIWISAVLGQFLSFDIYLSALNNYSYTRNVIGFGAFLSACVIGMGLMFPKISSFASKKKFWFLVGGFSMVVIFLLTFSYLSLRSKYTCSFSPFPENTSEFYLVKGAVPSAEYIAFMEKTPGMSNACLALPSFGQEIELMYDDDRWGRFVVMASNFIACWLFLSIIVVSLYQAKALRK